MDVKLVLCTFPDEEHAAEVIRTVVGEGLAACGNLVGSVRSIYTWKGEVCDEPEVLAFVKTTGARFDALKERVVALHRYECPEVIAIDVTAGHGPYLAWVLASSGG